MTRIAPLAASLALAALLTACTTMHSAPAQTYRSKDSQKLHVIQGDIERTDDLSGVNHMLTIKIDGTPAATGSIRRGTGDIVGTYNGTPIQALCSRQDRYRSGYDIHCRIVIGGEFVSTLTF
jgi:hypothetical protein